MGFERFTVQGNRRPRVLERLLKSWYAEFSLLNGLPKELPAHYWQWDGFEHIDPLKEATAAKVRLENGITTLAQELAGYGLDWQDVIRQQEIERLYREQVRRELGQEDE